MNYLTRPIFPLKPNWAEAVMRQITYDLRETDIGFGAAYFTPLATYTVNAFDFTLLLNGAADVLAFEDFCDTQLGRLNGFWLASPQSAAQFAAGVSTTQFDIMAEDLNASWDSRPDQHLLLTFPDGSQYAAKMSAVIDNGDGTERITLSAAIASTPPAGTILQRLHFVRFASDTEEISWFAENVGRIQLTVIELPQEYANAATGQQPVYLYDIHAAAPVGMHWRYTSFAAPVVSSNELFAVWPMTHGEITSTSDAQDNPVSIEARPDDSHPFSLLAGIPPGKVIWIDIYAVELTDVDTRLKLFSGYISTVNDDGLKYTAKCESRMAWLRTKLPRFFIGSACNHVLFDPATCKLKRALWETTVTFDSIADATKPWAIRVTFNFPFNLDKYKTDDWFVGGLVESGLGVNYEIRSVTKSHWNGAQLEISLNAPFRHAAIADQLQLVSGCPHTADACKAFGNFDNFGGFVAVPDRNLALKGLNTSVSAGNKK